MKKSFAIAVVVLLSSAMFLVGVCVAGRPESTPTKPMVAQWTGTLYNVGVCPFSPTDILTVNFGQGHSTVLGPASFVFIYCINPENSTGSGWGTITTANGDKLYVSITNLMAPTPTTWEEHEELLGGTGRFENASGYGESSGFYTSEGGFPFGINVPPPVLLPPGEESGVLNWIGTTIGEIKF